MHIGYSTTLSGLISATGQINQIVLPNNKCVFIELKRIISKRNLWVRSFIRTSIRHEITGKNQHFIEIWPPWLAWAHNYNTAPSWTRQLVNTGALRCEKHKHTQLRDSISTAFSAFTAPHVLHYKQVFVDSLWISGFRAEMLDWIKSKRLKRTDCFTVLLKSCSVLLSVGNSYSGNSEPIVGFFLTSISHMTRADGFALSDWSESEWLSLKTDWYQPWGLTHDPEKCLRWHVTSARSRQPH